MSIIDLSKVDWNRELDNFEFPETFDFGASTSGYQVEGGFNGPDDPKNNWYWSEAQGKKERTCACTLFLERYEEDLDRARWIGLNAFRMGIEWARLQPGIDPALKTPQPFSADAARIYAKIMAAAYDRGMFPAVTLHHFTNPLWAGLDLWQDWGRVRELFTAYVEFAVTEINRILHDEMGRPPIPYYITLNEPISVPMAAYMFGVFPRGEAKGWRAALTCYINTLKAHILAYRTIHRIYREKNWAHPIVTTNSWSSASYPMDKMGHDLFLARANGVDREQIHTYLAEQRRAFHDRLRSMPYHHGPQAIKRAADKLIDGAVWRRLKPNVMSDFIDLIYAGDEPRLLDALGFDLYDPFQGNNLEFGFPRLVWLRIQPYQWQINPWALGPFVEGYSWTAAGLPLHLLETGMCHRCAGGRVYPHPSNVLRDEALKLIILEVVRVIRGGYNLRSFYYWSLLDNYEWGSFEPRFGLFGVDFENNARRLNTDIMGTNAAGLYKLFIQAFRNRDKNALREAFTAKTYPSIENK